ncbi:hypothetical protein F5Y11DRAFT_315307 [Daldinia sp. FL1419]|nr:hypothetical protein F5Y11DRAFT_315307 [Daldinia sp. FL1419]
MRNNSFQKRTQFSSCDACRRSRVACDASKRGYQPGKVDWTGSCSRCALRTQLCTFEWINSVKRKPLVSYSPSTEADPAIPHEPPRQVASFPTEEQNCDQSIPQDPQTYTDVSLDDQYDTNYPTLSDGPDTRPIEPQVDLADTLLTNWCDRIFHHGFENIFGLMVGRDGCPFVNDPTSQICIPPTELFAKLDADIDNTITCQASGSEPEIDRRRQQKNIQLNQSLKQVIRSFTVHWLPMVSHKNGLTKDQIEDLVRENWRRARKCMLKVVNFVSYRSALTLYIFAQTPIPVGISEDEESDGISGLVCIQTALLQIQRLRERNLSHSPRVSEISAWVDILASPASVPRPAQTYLDFEGRAYWAAVIWDTSNSLALNIRTSLTSGLNGACSEPTWRLTKAFLVDVLHSQKDYWHINSFDMSDGVAFRIITTTAVCTLYIWKNITSLKEALREGVDDEAVSFVWNAFLDAFDIFKTSIRPLLNDLQKRLLFLDQLVRLAWYEVNLQYNLGILMLSNALTLANRFDLLSQITEAQQDAEHESFNVLKFGLENTYTLYRSRKESGGTHSDVMVKFPEEHTAVSLIAIDPYPNRVVDCILLMSKIISREYCQGRIKHENYSYLSSILLKALDELPQSAKTVQTARNDLKQTFHRANEAVGE